MTFRIEPVDDEIFAELRKFDTPTVCNVIELFDIRPRNTGFMDRRIEARFPHLPPIVGYATTATFRSAQPAAADDAYTLISGQVERFATELPEPRIVVFHDLDDPPLGATFGEVMCTVYKAFGCAGLVTSGYARDLEQVGRLEFPCFSAGVSPSHACCRIVDVHVPVHVGGIEVRPGDILHADANGVTTIPHEIVREVARGCAKLVRAEEEVIAYARDSASPTIEGLKDAQARMRTAFERIAGESRREEH